MICVGFKCENKKEKKGNICCNDCTIKDCKDSCYNSNKDCGEYTEKSIKVDSEEEDC